MKTFKKVVWFAVALIFLGVQWVWDHLHPIISKIVAWLPLEGLKRQVAAFMDRLPPYPTLFVFLIPLLSSEPIKLVGFWMMAHHQWLLGVALYIFSEVMRFGLVAWLFQICRDKLLSIGWFNWLYQWFLRAEAWAHAQTEPVKAWLRAAFQHEGLTNSHHHSLLRRLVALWRYTKARRAENRL